MGSDRVQGVVLDWRGGGKRGGGDKVWCLSGIRAVGFSALLASVLLGSVLYILAVLNGRMKI